MSPVCHPTRASLRASFVDQAGDVAMQQYGAALAGRDRAAVVQWAQERRQDAFDRASEARTARLLRAELLAARRGRPAIAEPLARVLRGNLTADSSPASYLEELTR